MLSHEEARDLLGAAGFTSVRGPVSARITPGEAMSFAARMSVVPLAVLDPDDPAAAEERWLATLSAEEVVAADGTVLVAVGGVRPQTWFQAQIPARLDGHLSMRLEESGHSPELLALSPNGDRVCGLYGEEHETWIVCVPVVE